MRNVEFKDGQENDFCAVVSNVKKYAYAYDKCSEVTSYTNIYVILRFINLIARIFPMEARFNQNMS